MPFSHGSHSLYNCSDSSDLYLMISTFIKFMFQEGLKNSIVPYIIEDVDKYQSLRNYLEG